MRRILRKYAIALVLASALLLSSATIALASHKADYDWYSWEGYYNGPRDSTLGITYREYTSDWIQQYWEAAYWYYHGDASTYWYDAGNYWQRYRNNYTWYDEGEMNYRGAGSYDWYRLYNHERAHQTGWDHYEEPYAANAAYSPTINLCQC